MALDLKDVNNASSFLERLKSAGMFSYKDVPPVNVEKICEKLGITVLFEDLGEMAREHGRDNVYGALIVSPEVTAIMVNDTDHYVRQRFTIAHELAHYVLHRDHDKPDEVFISFRGASSPEERQANRFAADLLMPKDIVRERHADKVLPLLWHLSEEFSVSQEAMRLQLESLGLRYYAA